MIVTAELAYHYNWQYMYYFMMMMLMASILIVIVCFRHNRPLKPIRLSELHSGNACHCHRIADADVRHQLWESTRLDVFF